MSEKEITQTIMFINTLGYYQCYDAVKEWFKWDDKTTKENIKFVFNEKIKKRSMEEWEKKIRQQEDFNGPNNTLGV